jgi:hypothetical protein
MRVLMCGAIVVACATSVVLLSFALFLSGAWLLNSAPPVQTLALTGLSVCGSGVIALMEFTDYWKLRRH